MKPTTHLRFVERTLNAGEAAKQNKPAFHTFRVLQQWRTSPELNGKGEWVDVPLEKEDNMEDWQKAQLVVATGVTEPEIHSTVYIGIIEELETENRMLRARNERLTMAMKKMERILQENLR